MLLSQAITVPLTVDNLGDQVSPAAVVALDARSTGNVNAPVIHLGRTTVSPGVAAGGARTASIVADLTKLVPGRYDLAVVVDPDHRIADRNPNNNRVTLPEPLLVEAQLGALAKGAHGKVLNFSQPDGTHLSFVLTGPGTVTIVPDGTGWDLNLTGTTLASSLSVGVIGGSATLKRLTADSALGDLLAAGMTLAGSVNIAGGTRNLSLGDVVGPSSIVVGNAGVKLTLSAGNVRDLTVTSAAPIASLAVKHWLDSDGTLDVIHAPSLALVTASGDFQASLDLAGEGKGGLTLGSALIGGKLSGVWSAKGGGGSVSAAVISSAWRANFTDTLWLLSTAHDASGQLAASNLHFLVVGGDLDGARYLVGANLGADAQLGGSGANSDSFGSAELRGQCHTL